MTHLHWLLSQSQVDDPKDLGDSSIQNGGGRKKKAISIESALISNYYFYTFYYFSRIIPGTESEWFFTYGSTGAGCEILSGGPLRGIFLQKLMWLTKLWIFFSNFKRPISSLISNSATRESRTKSLMLCLCAQKLHRSGSCLQCAYFGLMVSHLGMAMGKIRPKSVTITLQCHRWSLCLLSYLNILGCYSIILRTTSFWFFLPKKLGFFKRGRLDFDLSRQG